MLAILCKYHIIASRLDNEVIFVSEQVPSPINDLERHISEFRDPVELYMPDQNSCVSCVVANILFMYGKSTEPVVQSIDKELERKTGEPLVINTAYLYLLRQGFSMDFVDEFDEEAFIDQGLPYLKEFYKDTWTGPSFDNYWTPEKVRERQEARRMSMQEFNAYGDKTTSTIKTPTIGDIDGFLDEGKVVLVTVESGNDNGLTHATLVHGRDAEGYYKLYSPRTETAEQYDVTLFSASRDYLVRNLLPDEGIVGLTLKSDSPYQS